MNIWYHPRKDEFIEIRSIHGAYVKMFPEKFGIDLEDYQDLVDGDGTYTEFADLAEENGWCRISLFLHGKMKTIVLEHYHMSYYDLDRLIRKIIDRYSVYEDYSISIQNGQSGENIIIPSVSEYLKKGSVEYFVKEKSKAMEFHSSYKNLFKLSEVEKNDLICKFGVNTGIDLSSYPYDNIPAKIYELAKKLTENLGDYLSGREINDNILQINGWPPIVIYMIKNRYLDDDILSGIYYPRNRDEYDSYHAIFIEFNSKLKKEDFRRKKDVIFNNIKYLLHHEVGHVYKNIQYRNGEGNPIQKGIYDENLNIINRDRYMKDREEIDSNLLMVKEQLRDVMPSISSMIFDRLGSGESFSKLLPKILNKSGAWIVLSRGQSSHFLKLF